MKTVIFVLILIHALAFSIARAEPRPVSPETKQDLKGQGQDYGYDTKSILTPAYGVISQDIQAARAEIIQIINNLAGDDLKAFDGHWVVNIYADQNPNAWVRNLFHAERTWNGDQRDKVKETSYRKAMGFVDDGKPIYEFGFSTGLFALFDTRDQLAFVIGHELTHLLENHLSAESGRVASQQREVVADAGSVKRMIGKYNLQDATEAMTRGHGEVGAHGSPASLIDVLVSGAGSHHHEGQRIAALQILVKASLANNEEAQKVRTSTPLSKAFAIHSKNKRRNPDPRFDGMWGKYYRELVAKVFLANRYADHLMQEGHGVSDVERPSTVLRPTQEQKGKLLIELLQTIDSSGQSKTLKLNSFLQVLIAMMSDLSSDNISFRDLTTFQLNEVARFMLKQSVGDSAWKYADYVEVEKFMKPEKRLQLNQMFLSLPEGRAILAQLVKLSPEWNRLYYGLHKAERFYALDGRINADVLEKEIIRVNRVKASPLGDVYFKNLIETVRSLPWNEGRPRFWSLEGAIGQDTKIQPFLDILKVGQKNLNGEHEIYRQQILSDIRQTEVVFSDMYRFNTDKMNIATKMLNDLSLSLKDRKSIFQLMAFFIEDTPQEVEFKKSVAQFLNSLSNEERIVLLNEAPALLVRKKNRLLELVKANPPKNGEAAYKIIEAIETDGYSRYLSLKRYWGTFKAGVFRLFHYGEQTSFIGSISYPEIDKIFRNLESHSRDLLNIENASSINRKEPSYDTNKLQAHKHAHAMQVRALTMHLSSMSFFDFQKKWSFVAEITGVGNTIAQQDRDLVEKYLFDQMKVLSQTARYSLIKDKHLNSFLSAQTVAHILVDQVRTKARTSPSLAQLSEIVAEIYQDADLKEKTDIYKHFRNAVAEKWNLQPSTVAQVFPADERTLTQKSDQVKLEVRGLSALLAGTRGQSAVDQMHMIDYLMGRSQTWPAFVDKIDAELQEVRTEKVGTSFTIALKSVRDEMQMRSEVERSALVNSFLTGPSGLLQDSKNLAAVSERILAAVTPQNRDFARTMMEALYKAEGADKSLFLAYVLAQKSTTGVLSEGLVLKSLLDAYGVPGVKLAQYLSFTNEFKSFGAVLETYQDAALPLSYYDMLELIQERLGDKWKAGKYRVVKVIGTGSVNVAVEYLNLETGKPGVLNISRQNITTKTAEDFHRFEALLKALRENPANAGKFDFVTGLMGIIKKSVSLEFDKQHAFEMQREVQALYNRDVNGWKVRTVDAYSREGMTIDMQKARGVGARHVLASDPQAYRSAMSALLAVEDGIIRGIGPDSSPRPTALNANPDMHDGQVLIDVKSKIVTILDFGQAERLSNSERMLGIELLRFISGVDSVKSAQSLLQARLKDMNITGQEAISEKFLADVLQRTDRMDRFVRLASGLNQRGYNIPLSSIHWVLAVNRAVKLGQKIGMPLEASYRNMLLTTKVGLSLKTYNQAADLVRPIPAANKPSAMMCSQILL